jgi:alpha-tubulin suppressor-like RCC1 family protein
MLASKGNTMCGLKKSGALWCWGSNFYGALGIGDAGTGDNKFLQPTQEQSKSSWKMVSVGLDQTACAIKNDASLWCWGSNGEGKFGNDSKMHSTIPVKIGSETTWVDVTAGSAFTCGLKADGTAWCWGFNSSGQLGDGTKTNRLSPVRVGGDSGWTQIAAGGESFTCGVRGEGETFCWGNNLHGKLGDGTEEMRLTPTAVKFD